MAEIVVNVITDDGGLHHPCGLQHIPNVGNFLAYYEALDKKYLSDHPDLAFEGEVLGVEITHEFRRWRPEGGSPSFKEITYATIYLKRMKKEAWIKTKGLRDEE